MHIIIYGFHLFPQFRRTIGPCHLEKSSTFPTPSSFTLLDVAKKKKKKEEKSRERRHGDERRTIVSKREHFSIRFLPLAIISSPSSLLIIRRDTSGRGRVQKYCRVAFAPGTDVSRQAPGPDFRGAPSPLCYWPFFNYRWAGRGFGQVDTPNPRTVRIESHV